MKLLAWLKKHLWCRWAHRADLCMPEVWNRGLRGPWHCTKCHPCSEGIDELLAKYAPMEGGVK